MRDLILDHPDQGVPEARALFHRLLLAEADPPAGAGPGDAVLVARIDRLLEMGALDEALALIERAGPESPELFRRWFDTGLLLDRSTEPCAALRQNPALSPTLPARVFCLARGGDWNAAEITLTLGQEVGSIPPAEEALLARFLDPELFEEEAEPPIPEPLTALDFLMREAVGLSRPPGQLPLAFLHPDLDPHTPMRMPDRRRRAAGAVRGARPPCPLRRLPLGGARGLRRGVGPGRRRAGARRRPRRGRPEGARRPAGRRGRRAFGARPAGGAGAGICRPAGGARSDGGAPRGPPGAGRAPAARGRRRRGAARGGRTTPAMRGFSPSRAPGLPPSSVDGDLVAAALAGLAGDPPRRRPRAAARATSRRADARGRRSSPPSTSCRAAARSIPPRSGRRSSRCAAPARRRARGRSRCRRSSGAASDGGRRTLARTLPRGDPGRARRLAKHGPVLRSRSQRLRRLSCSAWSGLRQRGPGRGRGLPRRPGRARDGARHAGAAAFGDPPALPLRLPRGLARGRPRGAHQGAEAPAGAARQPRRGRGRPAARRGRRRSGAPRRSGCATSACCRCSTPPASG